MNTLPIMNIHRSEQITEVAHMSAGHCHSVLLSVLCSAAASSSPVLSQSPGCPEARRKAVVIWRGLLGSAEQCALYICQRCVRLTFSNLGMNATYKHSPRMQFVHKSGTYCTLKTDQGLLPVICYPPSHACLIL